jgi:hypothetical protein
MTTKGDMVRYDSARERLGIGSANQILQVKSSLPSWETVALADTVLTTAGDVLYENNTPELARLPKGTDGDVLTLASGLPSWAAGSSGGKWEKLVYSEQTVTGGTLDASFTAKELLKIFFYSKKGSGTRATTLRIGSGGSISSANYGYNRLNQGTYETGSSFSQNNFLVQPDTTVNSAAFFTIDILNQDGDIKQITGIGTTADRPNTGCFGGGWSDSNQCNIVQMNNNLHGGTDSNVTAGSFIEVWGTDLNA